ncbi:hypothetical protein [Kineothrix sedimenti]|uniref:Uncharacterized protein n=1 Tax=Kineothrix sedimenti TaxID=3123317 RepID=A0ABZ3EUU5_9FIRM
MDCIGRITQLAQDYYTHGILVTLAVTEVSAQELQTLKGLGELSISLKRWRKKRSLDANAYVWVLMSKIASALGTSKDEVYEELLQKYGIIYEDENGYITVTVKSSVDMSKITGHWKRYKDNGKFISYLMIKGSSEYDTAEMSQFIDRVVEEAKDQDIETLPPDEIARMKQEWGV